MKLFANLRRFLDIIERRLLLSVFSGLLLVLILSVLSCASRDSDGNLRSRESQTSFESPATSECRTSPVKLYVPPNSDGRFNPEEYQKTFAAATELTEGGRAVEIVFSSDPGRASRAADSLSLDSADGEVKLIRETYPRGDFHMIFGDMTGLDWLGVWKIMLKVTEKLYAYKFRVIHNPNANACQVRAAVQSQLTSAIWWDSHGSRDGRLYCKPILALPSDVFIRKPSPSLKYLNLNACFSTNAIEQYSLQSLINRGVKVYSWDRKVNERTVQQTLESIILEQVRVVFKIP